MWGSNSPSLEYWATTFAAGVPTSDEGPFCGRGHGGIGGKDHFGHVEPDGKDRGV